jgi:hypothetical protein
MMSKIYSDLSRAQVVDLISRIGPFQTVLVQGESGIGKSAMLPEMASRFPKHRLLYCDLTTKDSGDMGVPKIVDVDGKEVCRFVPNEELGVHLAGDVILMLDELGKARKDVLTASLRLLHEGKIGEYSLSDKSIRFATSNLSAEGFGDKLYGYVGNRMTVVTMRKPNAQEWIEGYAIGAGVCSTILQSVNEYPQMLESYQTYKTCGENQYIFDPRQPSVSFVSPRSLKNASDILIATEDLDHDVRVHALTGTLGARAAQDIMSIDALHGQLPTWKEVIAAPSKARVPDSAGAMCLFVYSAISNVEKDTVAPLMTYLQRLKSEAQALFCSTALRTAKASIVSADADFLKWAKERSYIFQAQV